LSLPSDGYGIRDQIGRRDIFYPHAGAEFLICFTDILILIILLRISTIIAIVQPSAVGKTAEIHRVASYIAAVVLMAISLTQLVFDIQIPMDVMDNDMNPAPPLSITSRVLTLVAALSVFARAVKVKFQTRSEQCLVMVGVPYLHAYLL
jgi:hypothetical protein